MGKTVLGPLAEFIAIFLGVLLVGRFLERLALANPDKAGLFMWVAFFCIFIYQAISQIRRKWSDLSTNERIYACLGPILALIAVLFFTLATRFNNQVFLIPALVLGSVGFALGNFELAEQRGGFASLTQKQKVLFTVDTFAIAITGAALYFLITKSLGAIQFIPIVGLKIVTYWLLAAELPPKQQQEFKNGVLLVVGIVALLALVGALTGAQCVSR